MLLVNLSKPPPPTPLPTAIADGAPLMGQRGAHDVAAMVMQAKARALAAVAPGVSPYPDLIGPSRLRAGRDQPLPRADVLEFFAVGLEETPATPDVIRDAAGGDRAYVLEVIPLVFFGNGVRGMR